MSTDLLGEFERIVMLATLKLDAGAYALPIRRMIEDATGRAVSRGALYRTLDRLETKGLIESSFEQAGERRGGHPLKLFRPTPPGLEALRRSHAVLRAMSEGLEDLLESSS